MARPKKNTSPFAQINLNESLVSLVLGALVILVGVFLVFALAKNRAQITYNKINTAISTFQQPQKAAEEILQNQKKQTQTVKTYEVKKGDNLWKIAENVYGSGYNWVDIASANNLQNPGLLFSGTKLIIPDVPKITVATVQSTQNNSPSISGSSYKIVKGDNLWEISVRKYGDGFKWPDIAKVNNIQTPDLIYPDSVLKLP